MKKNLNVTNLCQILEQNFSKAIEYYTLAIECNPKEASYYGNRSFAYIKSEFYGKTKSQTKSSFKNPRK